MLLFRKTYHHDASLVAFAAVIFQVEVFWLVTPCSVVVGYQHSVVSEIHAASIFIFM